MRKIGALLATGFAIPAVIAGGAGPAMASDYNRTVNICNYSNQRVQVAKISDQAGGMVSEGWYTYVNGECATLVGRLSGHQALLFRQLSPDVTLFLHGRPHPSGDEGAYIEAMGITIVEGAVAGLEIVDDRIAGVRLADGTVVPRQTIVVATRMVARAGFLSELGLKAVPHPSGMGEHIPADPTGRTEVPGIWAAGNVSDLSAQVGGAAAAGAVAGAQINFDLVTEDAKAALQPYAPAGQPVSVIRGDRVGR